MKYQSICGALIALGLSLPSSADVLVVDQLDTQHCRLVAENTCESKKSKESKALAKCTQWHKNTAKDQQANTVVMEKATESERRRPNFDGSWKTITERSYVARYFDCPNELVQAASTEAAANKSAPAANRSITERLRLLKELREKSLITEAEYTAKKADILESL
ncbi:SHOCT domain-containing protein [Teredinibacter turnerae]|uniref:SHOCT domain-containing protein n=1 Tax=Teredinibacter turnerae TaxID=2426 RepID=UPI00035DFE18|nr:SHOCT domain-containing protein [Teredinibacter turnerae]